MTLEDGKWQWMAFCVRGLRYVTVDDGVTTDGVMVGLVVDGG